MSCKISPHILVIDDTPGDADFIVEQLSEVFGAAPRVSCAATLEQGLGYSPALPWEMVILDLNLPDSQGLTTLRKWRAYHPLVPVLAISGAVSEQMRVDLLQEGAHEIISKQDLSGRLFALSVLYIIERNRADYQRQQLEKLLNLSPDGVMVVTQDGRLRYHNPAALSLFGRSSEELSQEPLIFSGQEGQPVDLSILQGESERLGEMRLVNLDWRGEPCVLATIRDVTEQKKMEMQLVLTDRLASLGTVTAGVAHEINNPLASVVGNLELAEEHLEKLNGGPVELVEAVRDAREGAQQVREIVKDLKVFSGPEADQLGPVDVHQVIESSLRLAWPEMRDRARLVKDYAPGHLPPALANSSRLGQVLLNLLVNAAQSFEQEGAESNLVRVTTGLDERGRVRIAVSDNGCGMSPQVQKQLFTPFFTTKPVGMGTGLGLAISHRIVTSFGGELGLDSQPGAGTCITVHLPAASVAEQPEAAGGQVLAVKSMLVVDDQKAVGILFGKVFGASYRVTCFERAAPALERIQQGENFDIIFCDLAMPQMTGAQFYSALQSHNRGLEKRVVFMTGGAVTPALREFLTQIQNPRLDKPFDLKTLRSFVEGFMAGGQPAS